MSPAAGVGRLRNHRKAILQARQAHVGYTRPRPPGLQTAVCETAVCDIFHKTKILEPDLKAAPFRMVHELLARARISAEAAFQ